MCSECGKALPVRASDMKRQLRTILLFLLLGAVANVAVATAPFMRNSCFRGSRSHLRPGKSLACSPMIFSISGCNSRIDSNPLDVYLCVSGLRLGNRRCAVSAARQCL